MATPDDLRPDRRTTMLASGARGGDGLVRITFEPAQVATTTTSTPPAVSPDAVPAQPQFTG